MDKIVIEEKSFDKSIITDSIEHFKKEYEMDETVVRTVFKEFDNSSVENILIKTIVLNNRYSAGLNDFQSDKKNIAVDVKTMAEKIYSFAKQGRLDEYKNLEDIYDLIDELSDINDKNRPTSFLSKYLHWNYYIKNEKTEIPIFDRYTKGMIYRICKQSDLSCCKDITQEKIRDYRFFCKTYFVVKKYVEDKLLFENLSVKEFDMFLWYYGKKNKVYLD